MIDGFFDFVLATFALAFVYGLLILFIGIGGVLVRRIIRFFEEPV